MPAPTSFDWYPRIECIFNGSANFNATTAQVPAQPILVSAKHPLGAVHLSSNPWPLVANHSAQIAVTFDAAPSGPVPNGNFSLRIGSHFTSETPVGPSGVTSATLAPISGYIDSNQLLVEYQGDPYCNAGSTAFPFSSPLSGGSGGSGGTSGSVGAGTSHATATPTHPPVATSTPIAKSTASASGTHTPIGPASAVGAQVQGTDHTGVVIWVTIVTVLILLGGGVDGWYYLLRRTQDPLP